MGNIIGTPTEEPQTKDKPLEKIKDVPTKDKLLEINIGTKIE